jgi:hypothetical protein
MVCWRWHWLSEQRWRLGAHAVPRLSDTHAGRAHGTQPMLLEL